MAVFKAEDIKLKKEYGFFTVHFENTFSQIVKLDGGAFANFMGRECRINCLSGLCAYSGVNAYTILIKTDLKPKHSSYYGFDVSEIATKQGNIIGTLVYHSVDIDAVRYIYRSYATPKYQTIFTPEFSLSLVTESQTALDGNISYTMTFEIETVD